MFLYNPPQEPIEYLYYDDHIAVINKPAGLLSVSGRLDDYYDSAHTRVLKKFVYAEPAHRLDMATSGILVFSLSKLADRELKKQFRDKIITKKYEAIVWGQLELEEGSVDLPLICDYYNRPKQEVSFLMGKKSITQYKVLERLANNTTRVALVPITGRTHQLRVHMQSLGNPILGDRIYAHKAAYEMSKRLLLHSTYISFFHPKTNEKLTFSCKAPF